MYMHMHAHGALRRVCVRVTSPSLSLGACAVATAQRHARAPSATPTRARARRQAAAVATTTTRHGASADDDDSNDNNNVTAEASTRPTRSAASSSTTSPRDILDMTSPGSIRPMSVAEQRSRIEALLAMQARQRGGGNSDTDHTRRRETPGAMAAVVLPMASPLSATSSGDDTDASATHGVPAHGESSSSSSSSGGGAVVRAQGIAFDDSISDELFRLYADVSGDGEGMSASLQQQSQSQQQQGNSSNSNSTSTSASPAVPSLDDEAADGMAYGFVDDFDTTHDLVSGASSHTHAVVATSSPSSSSSSSHDERVLACVDMLCDDLYYCKTEVLRNFARTRGVTASNKAEMVLRLITVAHRDAHGANADLAVTRRVFGDVFHEDVRTSGLRRAWTNKALEASHMEQACARHLNFEQMANASKTLRVRRHAAESARVLRRLSRPFQHEYDKVATAAVGGVFRHYKADADRLVHTLPVSELVSPYAALLVSHVRYAQSSNLLTRAHVAEKLVQQLHVVLPANSIVVPTVATTTTTTSSSDSNSRTSDNDGDDMARDVHAPDSEHAALQRLMELLDGVVAEVERREACYAAPTASMRDRGRDTAAVLVADAMAFAQERHGSWAVDAAPAWAHDLARMFTHWEAVVRADLASVLGDVARYVFDVILHGVVRVYTLQRLYGSEVVSLTTDVPAAVRGSLKVAFERHYGGDVARAHNALRELTNYVMGGGVVGAGRSSGSGHRLLTPEKSVGVVRGEFFAAVLSQMTGTAASGSHAAFLRNNNSSSSDSANATSSSEQHRERVAVVLREVNATASTCTRVYGLTSLLVRITEDMRFHLRFAAVYRRLSGVDRKTVRTRSMYAMQRTLVYFEREFGLTPLSVKSVAFLVVVLTHFACRAATTNSSGSSSQRNGDASASGDGARRPVLERFASVTGRAELDVVALSEAGALDPRDLRVAFPPQLSYHSWLNESDTSAKSVYNVLPSVAVKGSANQAMLISQAPMMRALDAISRVPWRINRYMLHVQEAMVREGYGFAKIRPGFYPLHYVALSRGDVNFTAAAAARDGNDGSNDDRDAPDAPMLFNLTQRSSYELQQSADWKSLSELRSNRIHYLQALRQARSMVQFSHLYFPNSMDFRGRMYPLPGRLNHTGSDPFRALLEYAEPKLLGRVGLYWLKVHLANKFGMTKLSFDERVHFVDEHVADVVQSAEAPLHGDRWWQEASEPMQCLMACKELADALKCSQGVEHFASRLPVAVDGSYNGLQHYSAIGRDAYGAALVNLVPSPRPADAYTGILNEMLKSIHADAARDHPVAQRCLGTGRGQDKDHIKRKTIKRPIMTQVYGVTNYGMSEQILSELEKQNKSHGLWTQTDMREMAAYLREQVLVSLGVTFRETQNCRRWISEVAQKVWAAQPAELHNALCWTTPLGLVVRQPYKVRKECSFFTSDGYTRIPGDAVAPASRKQLTAMAPNLIHSLDATHLAMTALEMQRRGLSMMAVHDSYWTYACDLPTLSQILRQQFVDLYSRYDPLWELKEQWEEAFFYDLRRHGIKLPDPPPRGSLDLDVVLHSPYFFS